MVKFKLMISFDSKIIYDLSKMNFFHKKYKEISSKIVNFYVYKW